MTDIPSRALLYTKLDAGRKEWEARKAGAVEKWESLIRPRLIKIYWATEGSVRQVCSTVIHEGSAMSNSVATGSKSAGWLLMWITLAEYILEKEEPDD